MTHSVVESRDKNSEGYRPLFVVGCPRSGTTWVQLLLARSPDISTAPETQIFAYYLDHFRKQWRVEHTGRSAEPREGAGLSQLLSEQQFQELCTEVGRFVLDRIHELNPEASIVLEKSPRHALLADWILDLFPGAYILHVVRDPRDAASSIMRAASSWGEDWAPRHPAEAGRLWRAHVEGARRAREKTTLYREIRYEDLRASPVSELQQLFQWLGLSVDRDFCEEAVEACELEGLRRASDSVAKDGDLSLLPVTTSQKAFFGRGAVRGWREDLSHHSIRCIESACFELMEDLGYESAVARSSRRTFRTVLHDIVGRGRESIDWQLQRLMRYL